MSLTDLFVIGLGVEIAGAALLAKGLLMSSAAISALATWDGVSYGSTVGKCRDRVDAEVGLAALGFGFFCQLIGYIAILGGLESGTGTREAITAAILAVAALGVVPLLWSLVRERRFKQLLITVAIGGDRGEDNSDEEWTNQRVMHLVKLGRSAGWQPKESDEFESGVDGYVCRVFAIRVPRYLPMPEVRE